MAEMLHRTALFDTHVSLNGKMVDFAGWEMPIQFEGILAEARAVRSNSGLFDVSHMGRILLQGSDAANLLNWLTTANVPALRHNRARYTLVCTENGGILDDGIIYRLGDEEYMLICNAANREDVWSSLLMWRDTKFQNVMLDDRTFEVGMIAYQGPLAAETMNQLSPGLSESLRPFRIAMVEVDGISAYVARTGYTGEDGFEIMPDAAESAALWQRLMEMGAVPCGLGSRDVLRLEAGLLLHGSDMDATVNPLEAGLERFAHTDKESIYSAALQRSLEEGLKRKLVGISMVGRGVPRHGYRILREGSEIGVVTSGGYSPSLDSYIGLGYVQTDMASSGARLDVEVRGRVVEARVVDLPFYSRRRT